MNWEEIQKKWPDLKRRIAADEPELDTDGLERTEQGRRQLLLLIEAKYGAAAPVAEETASAIVEDREDSADGSGEPG